ncbi:glycosyl hydrolase 108 family protein [uncultured Kiloniella sp.]|uniref:glycoside hydrolase family 108 protein n=1 Tax=uncultured Kiloniella sp. TaxID=1133091 RepID=UPI00261076F1|nr:glycosyl hydrolase 108 family protein [uncultured Kiloniella sp.]
MSPISTQTNSERVYNQAISIVLAHEGGFVYDRDDPGGATNYGISLRWLRQVGDLNFDGFKDGDINRDGVVDERDIREMSVDDAKVFYRQLWWDKYAFDDLPPLPAIKVFDLAVNMGPRPAFRILQRAARSCCYVLEDDGIIGPATRTVIESVCNKNTGPDKHALVSAICSEAAGYYRYLIARKPAFSKYKNGWLNRAYYLPYQHLNGDLS